MVLALILLIIAYLLLWAGFKGKSLSDIADEARRGLGFGAASGPTGRRAARAAQAGATAGIVEE